MAEQAALGLPVEPDRTRAERVGEAIQVMRQLWAGDASAFAGTHYRLDRPTGYVRADPPPPVIVGGFGPQHEVILVALAIVRMLRGATARFGSLDDGLFDEQRIERDFASTSDGTAAQCWYWICKLQARFMAGDYATGA